MTGAHPRRNPNPRSRLRSCGSARPSFQRRKALARTIDGASQHGESKHSDAKHGTSNIGLQNIGRQTPNARPRIAAGRSDAMPEDIVRRYPRRSAAHPVPFRRRYIARALRSILRPKAYRAGRSSSPWKPAWTFRPVWPCRLSGWSAIELAEPPTSTFAPRPTPTEALPDTPA